MASCHPPCHQSSSDSSRQRAPIDQHPAESTRPNRKRSRNFGFQRRRTISSNNNNNNPLTLLRAIIMVTTLWYHSISGTRGRTTPMLIANAWTFTSSRTLSRSTRGIGGNPPSRRIVIPRGVQQNTRQIFHDTTTSFSEAFAQTRPQTRSPHCLFSTTTIVEGKNESAPVMTEQPEAATPSSTTNQEDWKESPLVNPTIQFETLLVPNSQLTKWITHPGLQKRLAKPDNWEFLKHVHPRIKMVQDYDDKKYKQLLLLPPGISHEAVANHTATGMISSEGTSGDDQDAWLAELLSEQGDNDNDSADAVVQKGPTRPMSFTPKQLSYQYILKRLLPESVHPLPSSYEQIGHVAHFNLKEKHLPFKHLIGSALLESTSGESIQTVVNKVGQVDGKFRTYECEILANEHPSSSEEDDPDSIVSSLETTVVEDGISIELNVAECYWCTRLSGERQELIKDMLKGRKRPKTKKGQAPKAPPPLVVADAFCGAGAICMLLAKKIKDQDKSWKPEQQHQQKQQPNDTGWQHEHPSLTILANDWNPKAIEYMKRSIASNGMDKEKDESLYHKFKLFCRDSYDFLSELGGEEQTTKANPYIKTALRTKKAAPAPKEPKPPKPLMPDHVLMNFPLEAPQFLGALRWWSWKRLRDEELRRTQNSHNQSWSPRFHIYTFARSSTPRANDEEEMAVNLVANELLPEPFVDDDDEDASSPGDDENATAYRRDELNQEFGTNFSTRIVRDVAPGKVVVLVSFNVTPKLIRYMQGDYF